MFESEDKKGNEMTQGGAASPVTANQKPAHATDGKPVPLGPSKLASQRRSQRVYLRTPVVVYGQAPDGGLFEEDTHTVVVNANGALILMTTKVNQHEKLLVLSKQTMQQSECYVAWIGESKEGKTEVGVGFVEPAPKFWGMTFPPEDWDPSQRKRAPDRAR